MNNQFQSPEPYENGPSHRFIHGPDVRNALSLSPEERTPLIDHPRIFMIPPPIGIIHVPAQYTVIVVNDLHQQQQWWHGLPADQQRYSSSSTSTFGHSPVRSNSESSSSSYDERMTSSEYETSSVPAIETDVSLTSEYEASSGRPVSGTDDVSNDYTSPSQTHQNDGCANDDESDVFYVDDNEHEPSKPEIDRWIWTKEGERKYLCALCGIKLPNDSRLRRHTSGLWHQENNEWILTIGTGSDGKQRYSCDLCDTSSSPLSLDELKRHVDSVSHKNEKYKIARYFKFLSSKTLTSPPIVDARISSLVRFIYDDSSDGGARLPYFFNKMFIVPSPHRHDAPFYNCGICDLIAMNEQQTENHVFDGMHEIRLEQAIADVRSTNNLEVGMISDKRKCYLCDIRYTDYKYHTQTPYHTERVVAHLKSSRFKNWEKGIVLKGGLPYCVLCQLSLIDADHMLQHVLDDAVHKRNLVQ